MSDPHPLADLSIDYPLVAGRIESIESNTRQLGEFVLAVLAGARALAAGPNVSPHVRVSIAHASQLVERIADDVTEFARELGCEHREDRDVLQFARSESPRSESLAG